MLGTMVPVDKIQESGIKNPGECPPGVAVFYKFLDYPLQYDRQGETSSSK